MRKCCDGEEEVEVMVEVEEKNLENSDSQTVLPVNQLQHRCSCQKRNIEHIWSLQQF